MRILRVQGRGRVNTEPDLVTLSFVVETKAKVYAECLSELNRRTEDLRTNLSAAGLDRAELSTTAFAVRYDTEYRNGRSAFVGYHASHDLHIEIPMDKSLLNEVLSHIAKGHSGVNVGLAFSVRDKDCLRKRVLAEAVRTARENAVTLAAAAGVNLGEIQQMEYGWSEIHIHDCDVAMVCDAAGPPSREYGADIDPEDVVAEDNVTLVYEIVA